MDDVYDALILAAKRKARFDGYNLAIVEIMSGLGGPNSFFGKPVILSAEWPEGEPEIDWRAFLQETRKRLR